MAARMTVYELTPDGPVEREMFAVDAREAVQRDPQRWSLTPPATDDAPRVPRRSRE